MKLTGAKNIFLAGLGICLMGNLSAQNESDALRYSRLYQTGTARYTAMGGAFGAFGADVSNAANNPAGIGVFRKNQITLSPALVFNSTKSSMLGEVNSASRTTFNLANLGAVFSTRLRKGRSTPYSGWQFFNFGLSYTKTSDLSRQTLSRGVNSESSLLDVFAANANQGLIGAYYESLAINAGLLVNDTLTGDFYAFDPPWPKAGKIQRQTIEGKGSMGDVSFAFSANYANTLFIGASFNINVLDYRQTAVYSEEDAGDSVMYFKNFSMKEYFRTRGSGISGKFGIIYRPVDFFRIGLSIHTPTLFTLTDNFTNDINATFDNGFTSEALSELGVFKYKFINPFRLQLSTGFIIGKYGLIGLEYEFVNYKASKFRDTNAGVPTFDDLNTRINSIYRGGHVFKAGGELKLEPFALRAGVNVATNPYHNYANTSSVWGLSAGAGYRSVTTGLFIDLAYSVYLTREMYWMYDPATAPRVDNSFQKHNVVLTAGLNF